MEVVQKIAVNQEQDLCHCARRFDVCDRAECNSLDARRIVAKAGTVLYSTSLSACRPSQVLSSLGISANCVLFFSVRATAKTGFTGMDDC